MKDSKNRRGLIVILVLSLVANVVLLAGIYFIGGVKTSFLDELELEWEFVK